MDSGAILDMEFWNTSPTKKQGAGNENAAPGNEPDAAQENESTKMNDTAPSTATEYTDDDIRRAAEALKPDVAQVEGSSVTAKPKRKPKPIDADPDADFVTANGKPVPNIRNVAALLATGFLGRIEFDSFTREILWNGLPCSDESILAIVCEVQSHYHEGQFVFAKAGDDTIYKAIRRVAAVNTINSAAEWLRTLPAWDSTTRIDHFFVDVCGVDETAYTLGVGHYFWRTLVGRMLSPGYRADSAVVLLGPQGNGKTSLLRIIGGDRYGTASFHRIGEPDWCLKNLGHIVVEFSEFAGHKRAEIETIKGVLTETVDKYRAPYGRKAEAHPRGNIFVGTVNEEEFLTDTTGNRRWLPIACNALIDVALVAANREQYFAEALAVIDSGDAREYWAIPGARGEQSARVVRDPWVDVLDAKLNALGTRALSIDNAGIYLALGIPAERQTGATGRRIAAVMRSLGFERGSWEADDGRKVRGYTRDN